jgi:hypothetical protein
LGTVRSLNVYQYPPVTFVSELMSSSRTVVPAAPLPEPELPAPEELPPLEDVLPPEELPELEPGLTPLPDELEELP